MKPVLILQNHEFDGPAYLGHWLSTRGIPFEVGNAEAGEEFPLVLDGHSALAMLGGEMSVNDPLPSLQRAERLIHQALERDVPMLGHCLGGQLMAKAMGARVGRSPAPEIGWQPMQLLPGAEAERWFGTAEGAMLTVFQWHYEAFELPAGATLLARSDACPHEAFAIGPHLAMQFHIEQDLQKLQCWSSEQSALYRDAQSAYPGSVQSGEAMRRDAAQHMEAHQRIADRIYAQWMSATDWVRAG